MIHIRLKTRTPWTHFSSLEDFGFEGEKIFSRVRSMVKFSTGLSQAGIISKEIVYKVSLVEGSNDAIIHPVSISLLTLLPSPASIDAVCPRIPGAADD